MSIASFGNGTGTKRKVGALLLAAAVLSISSVNEPARAESESGLERASKVPGSWRSTA